jgi:hypothetical protein
MAFSINPLFFAAEKIGTGTEQKQFLGQLATLLNQMCTLINTQLNPQPAANVLNGQGLLFNSALQYKTVAQSSAANLAIDCVNAAGVAIIIVWTASGTRLTLQHLAPGVPVTVAYTNSTGAPGSWALSATDPSGTAYPSVFWKTSAGQQNMTSTGLTITTGATIVATGSGIAASNVYMVAN